jgi:hypothetical protein
MKTYENKQIECMASCHQKKTAENSDKTAKNADKTAEKAVKQLRMLTKQLRMLIKQLRMPRKQMRMHIFMSDKRQPICVIYTCNNS